MRKNTQKTHRNVFRWQCDRIWQTTFGGSPVCWLCSDLRKTLWNVMETVGGGTLKAGNLRRRQNVMIHVVIAPRCGKRYMPHVKPSSPSSKEKKKWTVHFRRPCTCRVNSLLWGCGHNSSRGDPSRLRMEIRSQCE